MKRSSILAGVALLGVGLTACGSELRTAQDQAVRQANSRQAYVPKHSVDFDNYNKRQRMSESPITIVWCTAFPPMANVKPITVPVVGKLTSGGKRPFRGHTAEGMESPGADGMYGASGEYRYGFTPGDNMVDFYNLPTFCTTEPTVWQRENTLLVVAQDPKLAAAGRAAKASLAAQPHNRSAALAAISAAEQ